MWRWCTFSGELLAASKTGGTAADPGSSSNGGKNDILRTGLPSSSSPGKEGGNARGSSTPLTVSIVFPTEAERNSFVLLLRTTLRILSGASVGDWEDTIDDMETEEGSTSDKARKSSDEQGRLASYESAEDLFKPFTYKVHDSDETGGKGAKEEAQEDRHGDHARLVQCIAVFGNGVNVQKVRILSRLALAKSSPCNRDTCTSAH